MASFLLPKSFSVELENIMGSFWWKNNHSKRGMHLCDWKSLCAPKEEGSMGFHHLSSFNIALLAKQGWRLLSNPNYLLARTLKARYFKDSDFLNSSMGSFPSFTRQSIWVARGLLLKGLGWRIGNGQKVSIWDDVWIPLMNRLQKGSSVFLFLCLSMKTLLYGGVSCQENSWSEVVRLLLQEGRDQLHSDHKQIYKKLWKMNLPSKIKITIWRNFVTICLVLVIFIISE